jgi:hypothetical protein
MTRKLLAVLIGTACAGAAWADPAGVPLAPAGACAEPRAELQTGPEQAKLDDDFEVAGSPLLHFTPQEVGAPGPEGLAQPGPPEPPIRGACDAPDTGCGLVGKRGLQEGPVDPSPLPGGQP